MMDSHVDTAPPAAHDLKHEATPMLNFATPSAPSLRTARRPFQAIRPGKGVNPLNPKPFKIGAVSVKPAGATGWAIRYRDPRSGRDARRRLSGLTPREVQSIATTINHELLANGGFLPGAKPTLPTVAEGIAQAIALRVQCERTRKNRIRCALQFGKWLGERHPQVKTWDHLRPSHLQEYALTMQQCGRAWDRIRLALEPVRLAWRFLSDNYPDTIRPLPKLKIARPPRREIEILEPAEVAALLDWTRENDSAVRPIFALAGLAGLGLQEATALRRCDVDLAGGMIAITKTAWHAPKNAASWRTIPLASEPLDALRHAIEAQKVIPPTGEIFANAAGNLWRADGLSARLGRSLDRASEATKKSRIAEHPARKLRAFFATTASRLGASDRALKRYLGHSGGSILDGHYRQLNLAELRTVSGLMQNWRTALAAVKSGNILATPSEESSQELEFIGASAACATNC